MGVANAYEHAVLVDTSAALRLHNPAERFHEEARQFFATEGLLFYCVDVTAHECFTRVRYDVGYQEAVEHFRFLRENERIRMIEFTAEDEAKAAWLLDRYQQHTLSFHDALCAAVMLRIGIPNVFTFDSDFFTMGFAVLPGVVG